MLGLQRVALALALLCVCAAPVRSAAAVAGQPVARTASGAVQGMREGDLVVFKGLPYAAPPVGELRWREPRDPAGWQGIRKADRFGKACIQVPRAAAREGAGDPGRLGEDCLTLNVWSPGTDARGKRPVMVWMLLKPLYPGVTGNAQLGREVVRDLAFTAFARRIAYLHSQSSPTWRYYFSHVPRAQRPAPPGVGHGGEIPFVLGTFDTCRCLPVRFTAADRALSQTVGDYWHGFARSGVPAAPGAPVWPKDSVRRAQVLEFGDAPAARTNFMRARLDVLIGALNGAERLHQPRN